MSAFEKTWRVPTGRCRSLLGCSGKRSRYALRWRFLHALIGLLIGLAADVGTVHGGLLLMFLACLLILYAAAWLQPISFFKSVGEVLPLAFSTSSSGAVIPLSITTSEE